MLARFFTSPGDELGVGLQSKLIVYAAIGGLLALMGGFVLYANLQNPELERVTVELEEVKVVSVDSISNRAELDVIFLVGNPSDQTFTVSLITYDLYVDGVFVGAGQYSTADIAMPGRAAFFAGTEIPLKSRISLVQNAENGDTYLDVVDGKSVDYTVEGVITVETSWSLVEKEFSA